MSCYQATKCGTESKARGRLRTLSPSGEHIMHTLLPDVTLPYELLCHDTLHQKGISQTLIVCALQIQVSLQAKAAPV